MELFNGMLERYQLALDTGAKYRLFSFLEEKQWKKEDAVKRQLQNMVDEMVYEKMLSENGRNTMIIEEELTDVIDKMKEKTMNRRQIGFV